jgi:hypothetical protein
MRVISTSANSEISVEASLGFKPFVYLCVLIVFSLHRESLKMILVEEPPPRGVSITGVAALTIVVVPGVHYLRCF